MKNAIDKATQMKSGRTIEASIVTAPLFLCELHPIQETILMSSYN